MIENWNVPAKVIYYESSLESACIFIFVGTVVVKKNAN